MYHVGHHEIILISPFLEAELLHRRHHFGSFLDRAVEDNTEVTLVTKPPKTKELGIYRDLEERVISVYFLSGLHSKLYIFNVDSAKQSEYTKTIQSKVIVGSSNLTRPGFGLDDDLLLGLVGSFGDQQDGLSNGLLVGGKVTSRPHPIGCRVDGEQ